ncbi:MAG: FlgD immunoglobulin-like domain containing protein, partial [bacterium]
FDDVYNTPSSMFPFTSQPATFDSVTMATFRQYLKNKFSVTELKNKFEINDIDTFHFGEWIFAHHMENTWNQGYLTGLSSEYYTFLLLEERKAFDEIGTFAHDYARNVYGRDFVIGAGIREALVFHLLDKFDFSQNESFIFHAVNPFAYTDIKAMKAVKDWPVGMIPEPTKPGLPETTKNMIKLIVADIYASGGYMVFGEKLSEGIASLEHPPISIDFDILARYVNFILSNSFLYENLQLQSQVGYLSSQASRNNPAFWPLEGNALVDYESSFYGGGRLLTDSNIQFDCIFAPDKRFTTISDFTLEKLQHYKVIVLPHTMELTDEQTETILNYVENGGVVVAYGSIGTNNPDGTLANRTTLLSLQSGDGVKSYGAGKFVYSSLNLGNEYTQHWSESGSELRRKFQSMILPNIKPYIKTENVSEVYRPGGATGFLYKDAAGNYVLHLVNYDYNEFSDEFSVKNNFDLKILADTTQTWEAVYVSPDFVGQQILPTSNDSGYIKLTIPKLEAYGIVILQQNEAAPQIISRSPSEDVMILAGDSLCFSVSARDPDNNPLFYQWYINGLVDSLGTDSTYIFISSHASSGIDTISVEVSDGSHKVRTQWLVTIQPYTYPKIIFDETHNQHFRARLSRAIELLIAEEGENYDPNHIEWVLCDKLINKLRKDYIVTSDTTEPLLLPTLQEADVLFLVPFRIDLSSEERTGIRDFIAQGGNLLILGISGWWQANEVSNGNLYRLLRDLGFKTYLPNVWSLDDTLWSSSVFMVDLSGSHPSTSFARKIQVESGHKLETTTDFAKIIETTGDLRVWEDINNNGIRDANEPLQSDVGIIGVSEYGEGKAVYISTYMIANDRADSPTQDVILSVMKWLTADVNLIVSVEGEESNSLIPESFDLSQNYPNPFNPTTTIRFQLPKRSKVSIKIYDLLGQEVRTLVDKDFEAGLHTVTWEGSNNKGSNVASGIYFFRMEAEDFTKVKKALFLK